MRRAGLWVGCINIFDVRESCAINECYELLRYPDTYNFTRGLALGSHSSSPSPAVVELPGRRVLPFLDPSASPVGVAFLFLSPPARGGEPSFSSSSFSREECVSELSDDESDTTWRWELFQVPVAIFLIFFSGTP